MLSLYFHYVPFPFKGEQKLSCNSISRDCSSFKISTCLMPSSRVAQLDPKVEI